MLDNQKRFTFAQLQLFSAWYHMGAVEASKCRIENPDECFDIIDFYDDSDERIGSAILPTLTALLAEGETIHLYDLLFTPTAEPKTRDKITGGEI